MVLFNDSWIWAFYLACQKADFSTFYKVENSYCLKEGGARLLAKKWKILRENPAFPEGRARGESCADNLHRMTPDWSGSLLYIHLNCVYPLSTAKYQMLLFCQYSLLLLTVIAHRILNSSKSFNAITHPFATVKTNEYLGSFTGS